MVTYSEFCFATHIVNSEELKDTPWEQQLPWEQEIVDRCYAVIDKYEKQQAELAAEDGEYDFPF